MLQSKGVLQWLMLVTENDAVMVEKGVARKNVEGSSEAPLPSLMVASSTP
jgi:hypothetical protein